MVRIILDIFKHLLNEIGTIGDQILTQAPAVPGAAGSFFSAKKTTASIAAAGTLVIADVGQLLFLLAAAGINLQIQDPAGTWTNVASPVGGMFPSDGANFRINNTTAGAVTVSYYIVK